MTDRAAEAAPLYWGDLPYHSLNYHLRQTFGEKVYRLSLNGGMTCPNRDGTIGTGGCIFCSAGGSGDFAAPASLPVREQIAQAKARIASKTDCRRFIAYFQAYTNTYAPVKRLRSLFSEAISHPDIAVLSIATRCDCLPPEVLLLLEELNRIKPVWVELGLQTVHEKTRRNIRSGFTLFQYEEAVAALRARGIDVITHLILGLPGEDRDMMRASVAYAASLPIQGIKLQLLHILEGTELGEQYKRGELSRDPAGSIADSPEAYCRFAAECVSVLPPETVIHRLTGDGPRRLLLSPLWSADKKRVLNTLRRTFTELNLWQGKNFARNP